MTMKFSSGNCRTRSCNGTFTVSLFVRRLHLPEVDCTDRSLAIDDGNGSILQVRVRRHLG